MFDSKEKEIDSKIDELLLKEPTPENLNLLGDLFLKKGDRKRAVDYFLRSVQITTNPKKAIALYKKILRISPLDTGVYEALIDLLVRSYYIPDAIKYLNLLSRLYQNKGETLKFTETQRRIRNLKHDWERAFPTRGTLKKEFKAFSSEVGVIPDKDVGKIEKVTDISERKPGLKKAIWISSVCLLTLLVIFLAILFFKGKEKIIIRDRFAEKRIDNYEIKISGITEKFTIQLPQDIDLKKASFNIITIKALEGCIPSKLIDKPYEFIVCLNDKGLETRPLTNHVIENENQIVYKYGACSQGYDIIYTVLYVACPLSHESGFKISGLITEPILITWERR